MVDDVLLEQIKRHEGLRLKPYRCPAGKWTIGYGRNLDDAGISELEAESLLANDVRRIENECLHAFPWFPDLTPPRQHVIINMVYNMGIFRVKQFTKFLSALNLGNYETAAQEMLASQWAQQVGGRAIELANQMRGAEPI